MSWSSDTGNAGQLIGEFREISEISAVTTTCGRFRSAKLAK